MSLAAFCLLASPANAEPLSRPQRIISMNLCTDQLLMRLVEPHRIASLSYLSWRKDAIAPELRPILAHTRPNRAVAEQVMMLKPDLVLTGAYSAMTTTPLLRRTGIRVVEFQPAVDFDGMRADIRKLGDAVGEPERAEQLIADFDRDLARLEGAVPTGPRPVYTDIGINTVIAGKETLHAAIANAAGFRTLGETLGIVGYRSLPLEVLLQTKPDLVSISNPYARSPALATQALGHPLLRRMLAENPQITLPGRLVDCPTPETLDAVRILLDARKQLDGRR